MYRTTQKGATILFRLQFDFLPVIRNAKKEEGYMHIKPIVYGNHYTSIVSSELDGTRLDSYLASTFQAYTRSFLQKIIKAEMVMLNDMPVKKGGVIVRKGDTVILCCPEKPDFDRPTVEDNALFNTISVVYEHPQFLIINKPAGVVVHSPNHYSTERTLVDWILERYQEVASVGVVDRPGIVHRLDKDTSGLLIISRTNYAHAVFGAMFKDRAIQKTYYALVHGHPDLEGAVDYAIGRHPHVRNKMHAYTNDSKGVARSALTYYKVLNYYQDTSLIEVKPTTGRTHQIRVHCAAIKHPLVGDNVYGKSSPLIKRHALHAFSLSFNFDNQSYSFQADFPADMQDLIAHFSFLA